MKCFRHDCSRPTAPGSMWCCPRHEKLDLIDDGRRAEERYCDGRHLQEHPVRDVVQVLGSRLGRQA